MAGVIFWPPIAATGRGDCVGTSPDVMLGAVDLSVDHRLSIRDAVILSAASRAGCRVLLSEDFQNGFTWGGVTVVNPFDDPPHPLLAGLPGVARRGSARSSAGRRSRL